MRYFAFEIRHSKRFIDQIKNVEFGYCAMVERRKTRYTAKWDESLWD